MKPRRYPFLGTLVVIALSQAANAGSLAWKGSTTGLAGGTNNTWDTNTTANWWNGSASVNWPALGGLDDDAVFGGTAGTVTLSTATANDIAFNTTGYIISGGTLTLNGTTPTITNSTGADATISSVIAGADGLKKEGAGTLTLSGANTYTGVTSINAGILKAGNGAALGSNTVKSTIASGAVLDVNGQNLGAEVVEVSGSGIGATGAITNTGAEQSQAFRFVTMLGATTFGGPNRWDIRKATSSTFDMGGFDLTKTGANYLGLVDTTINNPGNVTINQGTLNFTFASTIGLTATRTITVNNGGTLGLYQSSPLHGSNLILNTGSILRGENGSGAQNTWAGTITAAGEVTLQADGVLTLNSSVTGTANLTKSGGSSLTLAATGGISTTGNLTVTAGTLTANGPISNIGNLTMTGGTLTANGALAHTGTVSVSNGTLNINSTSSFTGATTLTNATLNLSYATDDNSKLPDGAALTLAGGTINLNGGTHSEYVASTTLAAGSSNAVNIPTGGTVLNLNTITVGAGSSLNLGADSLATTDNTNTNGILGTWATVGGNQWAVNSSGGPDGLITSLTDFVNTFTIADDNTLYQNKHVVVDSVQTPDAAINPLSFVFNSAAANSLTLQGTNTIATGGILVGTTVGNNLSTLTGGSLTGPLNGDLTINQRNTANSLSVVSSIVDNGTTNLVKTGTGTAILSGTNTYSGLTNITAGSLQISSATALGGAQVITSGQNSAALLLGEGVIVPSSKSITIVGSGANAFYGALSTASGNTGTSEWQGPVTIGALTGTRIGTLGGTLLVSGNIGESAAGSQLAVRNNETVNATTILSGNNTFSGGLQLVVGNLRMASANALGTGMLSLGSGGNVNAFSSDSTTPRTITVPTSLTATGTINLGDATLNGKLTFTGGVALGAATRTVATNSTVEFSSAISSTGAFGLTKAGAGDLILSSANTFTGATSINAGTVVVSHKDALATNSSVFISTNSGGGTLRLATDVSVNIARIESSSSNPGKIVSDRATPGAGFNHVIPVGWFGANTYTFEAGANVTSGVAGITFNSANLTAGSTSTAVLNPTTAVVTINGPVNIGLNNFAKTLRLDGTNSGNLISGVISNGINTLSILKSGTSTWELSGANTFTGSLTVSGGTLAVSGNKTGSIGAITVSNTAGLDGTLNIQNGTYALGANNFIVGGAQTTPATGTVNQSGGVVSFSGGNGLLLGNAGTTASTGIYNLSGGSINTATAVTSRGVMLGANNNSINTFNLSGTGALNMTTATGGTDTSVLHVGRFDSAANGTTNTFNQSGGTANVAILSVGGNGATGSGVVSTINWTGGTFIAASFPRMAAGNTNTATLTIGGTADVTLPAFPTVRGTTSTATLYLDGGVLKPSATSSAYISGLTNAYIKSGGAKFHTNSFDITVSQNLLTDTVSTGGGLTKEGSGTLSLTGTNTYTGNTTVTAGALSLGNGTTNTGLADAADVSVASGATLNLNYSGTDTIDELWLGGVQKPAGVYGSSDPSGLITGSGTLTVTTGPSASAYDNWATVTHGLTGPNAAFDFDYDNDGIDNGLEWILGGNPTTSSTGILPLATRNLAGDLVLTFTRAEASITETTLKVEFGTDLASWPKQATIGATSSGPDANGVVVSINTAASPDAVTVTIPASNAPSGRIFARLNASKP
jgi:autotransporter-associated beta strand protein